MSVFCKVCGAIVPNNQHFCPNCGAVVDRPQVSAQALEVSMEDTVAMSVKEAEIYYDGARVRNSGTVHLKEGTNHFWVRNLAPSVSEETIQLSVKGLVSRFMEPAPGTVKAGESQEKEIALLERQIEVLRKQEDLLEMNADFTSKTNVTLSETMQYLKDLPEMIAEIDAEINAKEDALKQLRKQAETSEEQLLEAEVECNAEGDYPFALTYVTRSASWEPFYDIYANAEDDILIQLKGRVRQLSEADWENCKVTLCSGYVNRSGNLPVLRPQYFYGQSAVNYNVSRQPRAKMMMPSMAMPAGAAAPTPMMAMASPQVDAVEDFEDTMELAVADIKSGNVTRYGLPDTYRIVHGDKGAVLNIHSFKAEGDFRYESCPKLDDSAYLVAEIKDFRELHLMECKANIFLQGNYVGDTRVNPDQEEEFVLSLGRDERIEVSREEKKVHHTAALLKNTQSQTYEYVLTVRNSGSDAVDVRLYDQLPISRTQEIKVEAGTLSNGSLDEQNGKVTWNFTLKPEEKKELTLSYTVTWPKGTILG